MEDELEEQFIDQRVPRPVSKEVWNLLMFGSVLPQMAWSSSALIAAVLLVVIRDPQGEIARGGADFVYSTMGLFVAAGVVLLVVATLDGLRKVRIVRGGYLTRALLENTRKTIFVAGGSQNRVGSGKPIYELTFRFRDHLGRDQTARVYSASFEHLTDEKYERILFDPADPTRAHLFDELPAGLVVDEKGDIQLPQATWGPFLLMFPCLGVFTIALTALYGLAKLAGLAP